jgi:hypothetical protein
MGRYEESSSCVAQSDTTRALQACDEAKREFGFRRVNPVTATYSSSAEQRFLLGEGNGLQALGLVELAKGWQAWPSGSDEREPAEVSEMMAAWATNTMCRFDDRIC